MTKEVEKFEDNRGKVRICLSCDIVDIANNNLRICSRCNSIGYIAYWKTKELFFGFVSMYGLGNIKIVNQSLISETLKKFS